MTFMLLVLKMALGATYEYKIILLGEVGVGKTTFFFRVRDQKFVDTEHTRSPERLIQTLQIRDTEVKVSSSYTLKSRDHLKCGF